MAQINVILVGSSTYLHTFMEILILHFCVSIEGIFLLIKAKLLYYLKLLELHIYVDYVLFLKDLELFNEKLSELQSEVRKYISILGKVKELLTKLNKSLSPTIGNFSSILSAFYKIVKILLCKLKILCSFCGKLTGLSCTEQSSGSLNGCSTERIIVTWKEVLGNKIMVSIRNINSSDFHDFHKGLKAITDILKMIEMKDIFDVMFSAGIMSIVGQLSIIQTLNLGKLYILTNQTQMLYEVVFIRGYFLKCTIESFDHLVRNMSELFDLMKFDCRNVNQFLGKCVELEKYITTRSKNINNLIKKLGESCKRCEGCIFRKQLIDIFEIIIKIIILLKFYVDLIAREILIFKNIIHTLIHMAVSSSILEVLMTEIVNNIENVEDAIPRLMGIHVYLKTFHFIQLENTIVIFGLSNALKFAGFINQYYGVLVINLYLINWLIWVIECYINHLIVFKSTSMGLNSQIENVSGLKNIIVQISNVVKSMFTITNKLISIKSSIAQLKTVGDDMDITKWKEKQITIRNEIKLINDYIYDIDSQIDPIIRYLASIYKSLGTLFSVYYFLFVLISYVYLELIKTNKHTQMSVSIGNEYYGAAIGSVMDPCNKQLKFILFYLVDMWVYIVNLIKVVETTIVLIIMKMGWLKTLTRVLKVDVDKINKGVVDMECAIEGVPRNFIRCSLQTTNNTAVKVLNDNLVDKLDNEVYPLYSVLNVMDYKVVIDRLLKSAKKIDQILKLVPWYDSCQCILMFEAFNIKIQLQIINLFKIMDKMSSQPMNKFLEFLGLDKIRQIHELRLGPNHSCLCMIVKYNMYPSIIRCIQTIGMDLTMLSTLSRKFTKYRLMECYTGDLIKILIFVINMVDKISTFIERRYLWATSEVQMIPGLICFCRAPDDKYYHLILNMVLVISSLLENVCTMDLQNIRMGIEYVSNLLSEFEKIDSQSTKSFNLNIFKISFVSALSSRTQSCKLLATFRIIIDLISLSKNVKVLESFVRTYINHISLCDIFRFENVLKELKHYETQNSTPSLSGWFLNQYRSVNWPCRGCNNSNCCCNICVNLITLGIWMCIWLKVNIKLYESNKRYKERLNNLLKRICNHGDDCKCEELKKICDEICGEGCKPECPSTQLKAEIEKICKDDNCLCKEIPKLKESLTKCTEGKCECKDKEGGCCRCVCCKLLGASIRLLSNACKANVLEPYKNIAIELLGSSKHKRDVIKSIVNSINQTRLNNIYLLKNTNLAHNHDSNYPTVSNTGIERNWGYDTRYEHQVTDNSIKNDGYPNLLNAGNSYRSGGGKMFKLVLTRLLIAAVIIEMFVYMRLKYQPFMENTTDIENNLSKS